MSPRRRRHKSDDPLIALGGLVVVGLVLVKVGQWFWANWWGSWPYLTDDEEGGRRLNTMDTLDRMLDGDPFYVKITR